MLNLRISDSNESVLQERINKLLIKCLDFRNKISSLDISAVPNFKNREATLKDQIYAKFNQLQQQTLDQQIQINLFIEELLEPCDKPIPFFCNPKWTIYTTKERIVDQTKVSAPFKNILIVSQNKIASDWKTLEQCGISQQGDLLYVYIIKVQTQEVYSIDDNDSFNDEIDELFKKLNLSKNEINTNEFENFSQLTQNENDCKISGESIYNYQTTIIKSKPVKIMPPSCNDYKENVHTSRTPTASLDTNIVSYMPKNVQTLSVDSKSILEQSNTADIDIKGWKCSKCTYINEPTRPGCLICSDPRPDDYEVPINYKPSLSEIERLNKEKNSEMMILKLQKDEEYKRQKNYETYLSAHECNILENVEPVNCLICFTEVDVGEAITLAECLHVFCKECLSMHVLLCDQYPVICPYVDDVYNCVGIVLEKEIKALLPDEKFQDYLKKSLKTAEMHIKNSFHCRTADCYGWCEYDDGVNVFQCPVCKKNNCLTCKAIHENMDCKEHQKKFFSETSTNKQAKKSQKLLKKLIKKREAMHCPTCNIIILKKEGCDWLRCSMCGLEICWVTKQARWGPNGPGDTSGGCHCRENNTKCHPDCVNCH